MHPQFWRRVDYLEMKRNWTRTLKLLTPPLSVAHLGFTCKACTPKRMIKMIFRIPKEIGIQKSCLREVPSYVRDLIRYENITLKKVLYWCEWFSICLCFGWLSYILDQKSSKLIFALSICTEKMILTMDFEIVRNKNVIFLN